MTIFANLFVGIVSERAAEFRTNSQRGDHKSAWDLNYQSNHNSPSNSNSARSTPAPTWSQYKGSRAAVHNLAEAASPAMTVGGDNDDDSLAPGTSRSRVSSLAEIVQHSLRKHSVSLSPGTSPRLSEAHVARRSFSPRLSFAPSFSPSYSPSTTTRKKASKRASLDRVVKGLDFSMAVGSDANQDTRRDIDNRTDATEDTEANLDVLDARGSNSNFGTTAALSGPKDGGRRGLQRQRTVTRRQNVTFGRLLQNVLTIRRVAGTTSQHGPADQV